MPTFHVQQSSSCAVHNMLGTSPLEVYLGFLSKDPLSILSPILEETMMKGGPCTWASHKVYWSHSKDS
jgi:hypothetical protein